MTMTTQGAIQKILIIDDDKFLRDMYAIKFKEQGFEVDTAESVVEGIDRIRGGAVPDAVVFDVVMPGQDGYAFLEGLRKENLAPAAIKIALSNQGQDKDIERAMELGANAYIVKANSIPSEVVKKVLEHIHK